MLWSLLGSVVLIGISLAMDAFAVSMCDGMIYRDLPKRKSIIIPITFGVFQALMPIIGFYIGLALSQIDAFDAVDHWIAFALLLIIGGKMVFDGIRELIQSKAETKPCKECAARGAADGKWDDTSENINPTEYSDAEKPQEQVKKFSIVTVLLQGVATSIDALFTGFSLNTMIKDTVSNVQLWAWICVLIIGVITFVISFIGLIIGIKFGQLFKKKASVAEIIGGCVLILLAVKMVLSGYGIIGF